MARTEIHPIVAAIQAGNVETLRRLLTEKPDLATARLDGQRTLLHVAADWPGHFPNGAETVATLVAHGSDVNARFIGKHTETPLHWAASCDDVAVLDALLDHGADIEAPGAVISGGTPLADAVAFAQWRAARRLVERGARATLWQAAALGLPLESYVPASPQEVTNALWHACNGGQRGSAEYLLARGADPHWVGHDGLTPIQVAARSKATELAEWLRSR
jgi:ankyrin repeat protein